MADPGIADTSYADAATDMTTLLTHDRLPIDALLIRRSLYERLGGFDETLPEEYACWDLVQRYALRAKTAFLEEPLVAVAPFASFRAGQSAANDLLTLWRLWLDKGQHVLPEFQWNEMEQALMELADANGSALEIAQGAAVLRSLHHRPMDAHVEQLTGADEASPGTKPPARESSTYPRSGC